MRLVGEIKDQKLAGLFSNYLAYKEIENNTIEEDGTFEIWVYDEEKLNAAEAMFTEFLANPNAPQYKEAMKRNKIIQEQTASKEDQEQAPFIDARTTVFYHEVIPRGKLTMLLILVCVIVGFLSKLGDNIAFLRPLFITDILVNENMIRYAPNLPEIQHGEIWRLFSPMLIHFGFMHLLFNMMWLLDLGSMVEHKNGSLFLAVFILVVSGLSNLAQFYFVHPLFGGMSGVVYGLFGYIWMKGKFDPGSRFFLHKTTVVLMVGWYFLGLTGLLGNIANATHTVGLLAGVIWGFFSAGGMKRLIKR